MTPECQAFLEDFLQEAEKVIGQRYERQHAEGLRFPFEPTDALQEQYWRAVDEFHLGTMREIIQLGEIFVFVRPVES